MANLRTQPWGSESPKAAIGAFTDTIGSITPMTDPKTYTVYLLAHLRGSYNPSISINHSITAKTTAAVSSTESFSTESLYLF